MTDDTRRDDREPGIDSRPEGAHERALVTGGASGIGLEASLALARRGMHVVVADRNVAGGEETVARIRNAGGLAEFRELDLGDLAFVRRFAAAELGAGEPLSLLINNAGLLPPKDRATTRDGFELAFGVSYLGHFALTGLLLPALARSSGTPRVVAVASLAHSNGHLRFSDLQIERGYTAIRAYANSKLACLMFALELDRRAKAAGRPLISVAAHPGISKTSIAAGWEQEDRRKLHERIDVFGYHLTMRLFGQTAAEGAESLVFAGVEPSVEGGAFYGPTGIGQFGGRPGRVKPARRALDQGNAARLWQVSEELTGVRFEL